MATVPTSLRSGGCIKPTWNDLSPSQQAYASAWLLLTKLRALFAWTGESVFDTKPYTTITEAYYFGISFLRESGPLADRALLDLRRAVADNSCLIQTIKQDLQGLNLSDAWVAAAQQKLNGHRPH